MLEAIVRKSDGVVILVAKCGMKWGHKDNGPEASTCVVELDDPALEAWVLPKLESLDCVSYPYAEWEMVKTVEDDLAGGTIERTEPVMVNKGQKRLPMPDRKDAKIGPDRRCVANQAHRPVVASMETVAKKKSKNTVGEPPAPIVKVVAALEI